MFMVMFVLDDPNQLDAVLDAWHSDGVNGATIVESTGINRRRRAKLVGTTIMAGINRLMSSDEENHYTLFAIVRDEAVVERCLVAAESVVGNLDDPNTGVFAAWPVPVIKGVESAS